MAKNFPRTGKKVRPKTAIKGKRFLVRQMPQAKPETCKNSRPLVLPELLELGIDG